MYILYGSWFTTLAFHCNAKWPEGIQISLYKANCPSHMPHFSLGIPGKTIPPFWTHPFLNRHRPMHHIYAHWRTCRPCPVGTGASGKMGWAGAVDWFHWLKHQPWQLEITQKMEMFSREKTCRTYRKNWGKYTGFSKWEANLYLRHFPLPCVIVKG